MSISAKAAARVRALLHLVSWSFRGSCLQMEGGVARNHRRSGAKSMVPDAVLRVEPKPLHVGIRPSEAPTFGEDAGRASPAHADATLAQSNCR